MEMFMHKQKSRIIQQITKNPHGVSKTINFIQNKILDPWKYVTQNKLK